MVRKDFNSIFDTLCDYYNQKDLKENDAVKEIYFDQLKYYDPEDWLEIQKKLLAKYKYMPKVQEIISTASEIKSNNKSETDINKPVCECNLCNGMGYRIIINTSNNKNYEYVVACDCKNGDNKLYDGRTIKDEKHRSNYIVPRFSAVIPQEA